MHASSFSGLVLAYIRITSTLTEQLLSLAREETKWIRHTEKDLIYRVFVCVYDLYLEPDLVTAASICSSSFQPSHTQMLSLCSLTIRSDTPRVSGHRLIIPLGLLTLFCCYIFTPCGHVCAVTPDLGQTMIPVPVSCWLSCAPPLLLSLFGPEGREPELAPRWAVSHFFFAVSPSFTHQPRWYSLGNAAMAVSHRAGLRNGKIVYSV